MRIFYASDTTPNFSFSSYIWRNNLYLPLVDLGHDVVEFQYDLRETFQNLDPANSEMRDFIEKNRSKITLELLHQLRKAHAIKPVDLFFSYFYDACVLPEGIDEIKNMGIKTVNWYCNGSYQLRLVREIAPHYDWCLVPEKFRIKEYIAMGTKPIYCQEAANPNIYRPYGLPQEFDVTFVGQAYGDRLSYIKRLFDSGIDIRVWGQNWKKFSRELPEQILGDILSDLEMIQMYSRSKINLGFSSCGDTHKSGKRILQLRLRDFEVPMSGGFYMVEYMEELEEFFDIGKEIVCYTDEEDMVDKINYYLIHEAERKVISKAGYERCLRDHSWQNRFKMVFKEMEEKTLLSNYLKPDLYKNWLYEMWLELKDEWEIWEDTVRSLHKVLIEAQKNRKKFEDENQKLIDHVQKLQETENTLAVTTQKLQETENTLAVTAQKLQETKNSLQSTQQNLQELLNSHTYLLGLLFRDAAKSKRKFLLFPFRFIWFFVPSQLKDLIKNNDFYEEFVELIFPDRSNTAIKEKRIIIKNPEWPENRPLISVVIPCYNYGKYIEEAIDSVLNQTVQTFEIIVVDGGSTDEYTLQILKSLNKPQTNIYFRTGRHLVGDNRNFGIKRAKGKYICCLDADDKLRPTYLEKALFLAETYNYDIIYPSVQCFEANDDIWIAGEPKFPDIGENNIISTVAVFKKDAWKMAGGYRDWGLGDKYVFEDWEFWVRLLGYGFNAKRILEPLMLYRMHKNGLSANVKKTFAEQSSIIKEENKKLFSNRNLRKVIRRNKTSYSVTNPYINLKNNDSKRNILFALPFVITGGADTVILNIVRHLSSNNFHISVITTIEADEKSGDNTSGYEEITKEIYHLYKFLEKEEYWKDFIFYLIETRKIDIIFIVDCSYMYQILPEIREKYPDVKIVDRNFNEFGHIENIIEDLLT